MGIENLVTFRDQSLPVQWEKRDPRKVSEIARDRISLFFREWLSTATPFIIVGYQPHQGRISKAYHTLTRQSSVKHDLVFQGRTPEEIKVLPTFSRIKKKPVVTPLSRYLPDTEQVFLQFMCTYENKRHCYGVYVVDWNSGSSRVGYVAR